MRKEISLAMVAMLAVSLAMGAAIASHDKSMEKIHPELRQAMAGNSGLFSVSSAARHDVPVIIMLNDAAPGDAGRLLDAVEADVKAHGGKDVNGYATGNMVSAEIPAGMLSDVADNPEVKMIWPDKPVQALLDQSVPQIEAHQAWTGGFDGSGMKIAILDTGIDKEHPMLKGKVVAEKLFTDAPTTNDVYGHGTHCAGIAAGTKVNGGLYNGVAPGAMLMNGKVLNDKGSGSTSGIVAGINWAVDPDGNQSTDDGADVISMSLGAATCDPYEPMSMAIKSAVERGVVVVVAAGNCGDGCPSANCNGYTGVETPGCSPWAITVGAVSKSNNHACFSSGGNVPGVGIKPDVSAPGVDIKSSVPGSYSTMQGTSMATPHVAGAAAILMQKNPSMSPAQIKSILENTASDYGNLGEDTEFGWGVINLSAALKPRMAVAPSSISAKLVLGEEAGKTVTISNAGGNVLSVNVNHDSWIGTTMTSQHVEVQPLSSYSFTIVFNANRMGVGTFDGSLRISGDSDAIIPVKAVVYESYAPVIHQMNVPAFAFRGQELEVSIDVTDDESVASLAAYVSAGGSSNSVALRQESSRLWKGVYRAAAEGINVLEAVATDNKGQSTGANVTFVVGGMWSEMPGEIVEKSAVQMKAGYMNVYNYSADLGMEFTITDALGITVFRYVDAADDVPSEAVANFTALWTAEKFGAYRLDVVAMNGENVLANMSRNLLVSLPAIGDISGFTVSPQLLEKGKPLSFMATVHNTGSIPFDAVAEFDIIEGSDSVPKVIVADNNTVPAGSSINFSASEPVSLRAGEYSVAAKVHYGNRIISQSSSIRIYAPDACEVADLSWPAVAEFTDYANLSFTIASNASVQLSATAEAFILSGETQIDRFGAGSALIGPSSTVRLESGWVADTALSDNYTLMISIDCEGKIKTAEKDFSLKDSRAPEILSIGFSPLMVHGSPFSITAETSDAGGTAAVNVNLAGEGPVPMEKVYGSLNSTMWKTVLIPTGTGSNNFVVTACDTHGNCGNSSSYYFEIIPCVSPGVLVVSDGGDVRQFSGQLSSFCSAGWDTDRHGLPSPGYMQRFSAVIWTVGNSWNGISQKEAALLINYTESGGRLLLEGRGISFSHIDDEFMRKVAHSEHYEKPQFFLVNYSADSTVNRTINFTAGHLLTRDLLQSEEFDISTCPYPDSLEPLDSAEIATWNGGGSAMVAYNGIRNGIGGKTVFMPFAISALENFTREQLIKNSVEWLMISSGPDMQPSDITFSPAFVVEGMPVSINVTVDNLGASAAEAEVMLTADGSGVALARGNFSGNSSVIGFVVSLQAGTHTIDAVVNPYYTIPETEYLNNRKTTMVSVAPNRSIVHVINVSFSPPMPRKGEKVSAYVTVSNTGGIAAANATAVISLDGVLMDNLTLDLPPGSSKEFVTGFNPPAGIHSFEVLTPDKNATATLYVCGKKKMLFVEDYDSGSWSGEYPDSADVITSILRDGGFCYEAWNESGKGTPPAEYMNGFGLIIWSSGNYWSGVVNDEDSVALSNVKRSMIFEGADLALEHANDSFGRDTLHAGIERDVISSDGILPSGHKITSGMASMAFSKDKCPYPDAVSAEGEQVAEWDTGGSAITAYNGSPGNVFFALSLNALGENEGRQLMLNSIGWLNKPPSIAPVPPQTGFVGRAYIYLVNATDTDGEQIYYSDDSELFAIDDNGTINLTPHRTTIGNHSINITASDGLDISSIVMQMEIKDNTPPAIRSVSFSPSLKIGGDNVINVNITEDVNISSVYMSVGNSTYKLTLVYGSELSGTWNITFTPEFTGFYSFRIVAADSSNNTAISDPINFTVTEEQPAPPPDGGRGVNFNGAITQIVTPHVTNAIQGGSGDDEYVDGNMNESIRTPVPVSHNFSAPENGSVAQEPAVNGTVDGITGFLAEFTKWQNIPALFAIFMGFIIVALVIKFH